MTMRTYSNLINNMQFSPLSSIPFHSDIKCIERIVAKEFPFHVAIQHITGAQSMPRDYTRLHTHDVPEINIVLGNTDELVHGIHLGAEFYEVKSPSTIWIPPHLEHSANVISGSGYFICIILNQNYVAKQGFQNGKT